MKEKSKLNMLVRKAVGLIMGAMMIIALVPNSVNAVATINGSPFALYIEKTWDDNNNALGLRPDKVVYDIYIYQGEWTGVDNATLVEEGFTLTSDDKLATWDETTRKNVVDENTWVGYFDMGLMSDLVDVGYGARDAQEKDYPRQLTDENGNPYKFKFVERPVDGYVESSVTEPITVLSDFNVGDSSKLEQIGPNQYRIPNWDKIKATMTQVFEHYSDGTIDSVSTEPLPMLEFKKDGRTLIIPLGVTDRIDDVVTVSYTIPRELTAKYIEETYNYNPIEDGRNENIEVDDISLRLLYSVIEQYEGIEEEMSYYPFSISSDGILTMRETYIKDSHYDFEAGKMIDTKADNPFYSENGDMDSATYRMVTPLNRYSFSKAKSTNKLKEPVNVTVTKKWDDQNNADGSRPAEVAVTLLANGKEVDTQKLNKSNEWTYTWKNLPDMSEGETLNYTVQEKSIPDGYKSAIEMTDKKAATDDKGVKVTSIKYEITNTHEPKEDVPATGDDNNILPWVVMLITASAITSGYALHRKKHF